ncbi:MAG: thiol peroxidase [Tannerellaceae bacterium]|nr:thiol peroxidase [Tannerellaceae bacterium]MCD7915069.1 thiol peroxidase [Tannerellaceae bacterium]
MATITMKGKAVHTCGELPSIGSKAPNFTGTKRDLTELALSELKGKNVILNVFPSLDTEVCATSVRKFNKEAASLHNTVVLAISKDLPFAQGRFCTTEGIEKVMPLSVFRDTSFEEGYGMLLADGPLKGLLARSVIVVNEAGEVVYTELVPEITEEPNYEAALACIR